jgi:hypothetical protein
MLVIIPCGSEKRRTACPAQHLYVGPYFRACLRFARGLARGSGLAVGPRTAGTSRDWAGGSELAGADPGARKRGVILILSAKYGLLGLDDRVEPYNLRMGQPGCVTAAVVAEQARKRKVLHEPDVFALGGEEYVSVARQVWPHCRCPLGAEGGIGKQIGWLSLFSGSRRRAGRPRKAR